MRKNLKPSFFRILFESIDGGRRLKSKLREENIRFVYFHDLFLNTPGTAGGSGQNIGGNKFSHTGVSPKWVKSKRRREKKKKRRD